MWDSMFFGTSMCRRTCLLGFGSRSKTSCGAAGELFEELGPRALRHPRERWFGRFRTRERPPRHRATFSRDVHGALKLQAGEKGGNVDSFGFYRPHGLCDGL